MNTENIIEYIRRGVGLKFSKAFCWIEAFIFAYCFIPTGILDFQRFYYYKKLEKMGLATEDILKVED